MKPKTGFGITGVVLFALLAGGMLSSCNDSTSNHQKVLGGDGDPNAMEGEQNPEVKGGDGNPVPVSTAIRDYTYTPSNAVFPNPERGFYGGFDPLKERFRVSEYNEDVQNGRTLVMATVRLDKYRHSDLPAKLLDDLGKGLASLRSSPGIKAILRFSYNNGYIDDNPNTPQPDAPKNVILRHISQLRPIFHEYYDVIAFVHAGFIGAWGEWHHSTNGLLDDPRDSRDIIEALLDALPDSRMVQIRYPFKKRQLYSGREVDRGSAFSTDYVSRIGHHNDCFLSPVPEDEGYLPNNDATPAEIKEMKAYIHREGLYTPVGGETCAMGREDDAVNEMSYLRWSYVNIYWYPGMIAYWQGNGDYAVMQRKLGYRFRLLGGRITGKAAPGEDINLHITLRNDGWAVLYNPRPVYLVLENESERREILLKGVDPRSWQPDNEYVIDQKLPLPEGIARGEYKVALWLPDESPRLRDNPAFSIRFANQGDVWDSVKGYNILGKIDIGTAPDTPSRL